MDSEKLILVTEGTSVLGSHCLLQAVRKGYRTRTTIPTLKRKYEVRQMMENGGLTEAQACSVEIVEADINNQTSWEEACYGCTYVLHVARFFSDKMPADKDEWVSANRERALRVLRACKKAGTVKRVVLTNSHASIGRIKPPSTKDNPFTEDDWASPDDAHFVNKSHILTERAAWEWYASEAGNLEMTVINPALILGPILGKEQAPSMNLVTMLFNEVAAPMGAQITACGFADVRDVAWLHLRAMTDPRASGNRYLAVPDGGPIQLKEAAKMLKEDLPKDFAKQVNTDACPKIVLQVWGFFDNRIRDAVGKKLWERTYKSSKKAKTELGWEPRSSREVLLATAESLIEYGVIKPDATNNGR